MDLSHINQEIEQKRAEVDRVRRVLKQDQQASDQAFGSHNVDQARVYARDASNLSQRIRGMESEIRRLEDTRQRLEQQVHELERERDVLTQNFESELASLDDRIGRIRGV